jgi:hypothetical protein
MVKKSLNWVTNDCSESLGTNTQTMKGRSWKWVLGWDQVGIKLVWQSGKLWSFVGAKLKMKLETFFPWIIFVSIHNFIILFYFMFWGGGEVLWSVFSVHIFTDPNPNPRLFVWRMKDWTTKTLTKSVNQQPLVQHLLKSLLWLVCSWTPATKFMLGFTLVIYSTANTTNRWLLGKWMDVDD